MNEDLIRSLVEAMDDQQKAEFDAGFVIHDLKVGDKVRIQNIEDHPFAGEHLSNGDITVVTDVTPFYGMPSVSVKATKNIEGANNGEVPFADKDLAQLVKEGE